jgi:uncharacterized protein with PQ loop repeat
MAHNGLGLHHFHTRKRIHQKHEQYPHPDKWKRFMDKAVYAVGALGPLLTVPQLIKIWIDKNAAGVSVVSWSGFILYGFFWLAYGIMHKEKPIIFTYTLWIIFQAFIVIGAVIYG